MLKKLRIPKNKKIGMVPGSAIYTGDLVSDKATLSIMQYNSDVFEEKEIKDLAKLKEKKDFVSWLNIDTLSDTRLLESIAAKFHLHPLVLEDVLNVNQRPKCGSIETGLFTSLKMLQYDEKQKSVTHEQVSFVLHAGVLISFQERPGDVFGVIRDRIRQKKGRIRQAGADYLMYALFDAIVDHYFIILEKIAERIEALEEEIFSEPSPKTVQTIHYFKQELILLRKSIWPLRDLVSTLSRDDSGLISELSAPYLRDLYDHTIEVMDIVETYRDMTSGLMDMYLSSVSNRMNEIMKVLTIIATIFMPLGFIAGLYGMNFVWMPELKWVFGYPMALGIMSILALGMLAYFKKQKWI